MFVTVVPCGTICQLFSVFIGADISTAAPPAPRSPPRPPPPCLSTFLFVSSFACRHQPISTSALCHLGMKPSAVLTIARYHLPLCSAAKGHSTVFIANKRLEFIVYPSLALNNHDVVYQASGRFYSWQTQSRALPTDNRPELHRPGESPRFCMLYDPRKDGHPLCGSSSQRSCIVPS